MNTAGKALKRPTVVLLVDDQPMVCEALRRLLANDRDIALHFCTNPFEAVETAATVEPVIILLDLVMPGMDGVAVLKQLRQTPKTRRTPVIVLSTKEEAATKMEAFQAGANDYIVKIPDHIELLARIRYHAESYIARIQRDNAYLTLSESQEALSQSNIALHEANQKLQDANQARSGLLSNVGNEFQPLLNQIQQMVEKLAGTQLDPAQRRSIDSLKLASDALATLASQTFQTSQTPDAPSRSEVSHFDLSALLEDAFSQIKPQANGKSLTLEKRIAADVPPEVCGDAANLRHVLDRLLHNAVAYTNSGGITVRVRPNTDRHFPGTLVFSVRDTGEGMASSTLDSLSESLKRGEWGGTLKNHLAGRGLIESQQRVAQMGGQLRVQSEEGLGTTFSFSIDTTPPDIQPEQAPDLLAPALSELVPGYLAHLQDSYQQLTLARAQDDLDTIESIGHKLYRSGSSYGFDQISQIGGQLELAAQMGDPARLAQNLEQLGAFLSSQTAEG